MPLWAGERFLTQSHRLKPIQEARRSCQQTYLNTAGAFLSKHELLQHCSSLATIDFCLGQFEEHCLRCPTYPDSIRIEDCGILCEASAGHSGGRPDI